MARITGAYLIQAVTGRQIRTIPPEDRLLLGQLNNPSAMVVALPIVPEATTNAPASQIVCGPIPEGIGPAVVYRPQVWAQTEPTTSRSEVFCRPDGTVMPPSGGAADTKHRWRRCSRYVYLCTLEVLPSADGKPSYRFRAIEWNIGDSSPHGITLKGIYHVDITMSQPGLIVHCPKRWQTALQACLGQLGCPRQACNSTHVPLDPTVS